MADLDTIARRALIARDFEPDFPAKAREEVRRIVQGFPGNAEDEDGAYVTDLRDLFWFSIDNADTRDLDQLSVAEGERDGDVRLRVAIADVSALVRPDTSIDRRAWHNTTSIYTAAGTFPMLPPELSEGLTSLHEGEDRLAVVVDMTVDEDGLIKETQILRDVLDQEMADFGLEHLEHVLGIRLPVGSQMEQACRRELGAQPADQG